MRFRAAVTAGLVLAASLSSARAQQVPQKLTLEEAQRLARLHSPTFLRSENDLEVADANVRSAYGTFLPSLNSNLGFSGGGSSSLIGTDDFGRPVDAPRRIESQSGSASQGISSQVTLFNGASFRNLAAFKATRRATEARIAGEENRLKAAVARDYYNAFSARERIELENNVLRARLDALVRTEKLLGVAASKYVDVLSARVDVSSAEQTLEDARGAAEKARLQLKQTIGVEGPAQFELATELPAPFDPATLNEEAIVAQALTQSPLVRASLAQVAAADKQAAASRAGRWPIVTGNASYNRSATARSYTGAFGDLNPPNRNWNFGVGMLLPIFSRFTTSAQIANASAAEADARLDLRLNRLTVDREVRSAVIDLQSAYRRVQMASQRSALLTEILNASQEEYRLGTVSFFQLQTNADRAADAERAVLDARLTFANALVTLEERIGGPLNNSMSR